MFGICLAGMAAVGCTAQTEQEQEVTTASEQMLEETGTAVQDEQEEKQKAVFGEFEACDVNRERVTQEIFSNSEVTMVYMWASYSEECIRQLADLAVLAEEFTEHTDAGKFQIIGIPIDSLDQSGSASSIQMHQIRTILKETRAEFLQVIPSYDLITSKLKEVVLLPEILFVDSDGIQIGDWHSGLMELDTMRKLIQEELRP